RGPILFLALGLDVDAVTVKLAELLSPGLQQRRFIGARDDSVVLIGPHNLLEERLHQRDLLPHLLEARTHLCGRLSGAYERGLLLALDQIRARHAHDRVASSVLTVKVSPAGVSRTTPGTISPVSASTA